MWNNISINYMHWSVHPCNCSICIFLYKLHYIQVHSQYSTIFRAVILMLISPRQVNILLRSSLLSTVVAGRAKPQQPGQQSGRTALSGKQEGVREEGDGHRGAELGGRLSCVSLPALSSPSPSLHHPSTSASHFYLIKRKKKTASISEELKCHPKKKDSENNQTRMHISLLANTFEETRKGNQSYICAS